MTSEDYTYYVQQLDPALAEAIDEMYVEYFKQTGRPGFRVSQSVFDDVDLAVDRARVLHSEGHHVKVLVRFLEGVDENAASNPS